MDRTDTHDRESARKAAGSATNGHAPGNADPQPNERIRGASGKPTAPVAPVDREFRAILAQLELLSHGKTQSFNAMSKGENDNPRPFGEANPPHIIFRERWDAAPAHRRPEILTEARSELETARKAPQDRPEQTGDMDAWIVEDGKNHPADAVARQFNTTPSHVRKVRLAADCDSEYGLPTSQEVDNSRERVLYLASKGCTVRQIEMQTTVSKTQVHRILREDAA